MIKVFGRITASREDCVAIVKQCFSSILMCYEVADDGCSRDHCHFIGETDNSKNIKSLRMKISDLTKAATGESHQYSIKPYDPDKDAEAYICKGHKKDAAIKPEILINDYKENVESSYDRFHETASNIRADKHNKALWRDLLAYVEKTEPMFISKILKTHKGKYEHLNFRRVSYIQEHIYPEILKGLSLHLYDLILKTDRAIPNTYLAKQAITTVLSRLYHDTDSRQLISKTFIPTDLFFT